MRIAHCCKMRTMRKEPNIIQSDNKKHEKCRKEIEGMV